LGRKIKKKGGKFVRKKKVRPAPKKKKKKRAEKKKEMARGWGVGKKAGTVKGKRNSGREKRVPEKNGVV